MTRTSLRRATVVRFAGVTGEGVGVVSVSGARADSVPADLVGSPCCCSASLFWAAAAAAAARFIREGSAS